MPSELEKKSSKQPLTKIAVAARLLGKELHRLKLKRVDLRRVELRLGEKAYTTGTTDGQSELVSKLDRVTRRLTQLRQQEVQPLSTFGGKIKALISKIAKAIQIGVLQLKRRRLLKQLGAKLRQSATNSSLAEETQLARGVADRLSSVETEITQLAPETYPWARRPLLLACLVLLLAAIGGALALGHQPTPIVAQQRGRLSDAQMKSILAQQQAFQQQMLQMQAEMSRKEREQTQARIAAAERAQREEIERRRAEQERVRREEAERERVAVAERARQEEKQREEERRVAAAEKARQEQQAREAEAQREKSARKPRGELSRRNRELPRSPRLLTRHWSEMTLPQRVHLLLVMRSSRPLPRRSMISRAALRECRSRARRSSVEIKPSDFFDSSWAKAEEHVEGDKATGKNGLISYRLEKRGPTWQVTLPEVTDSNLLRVASSLTQNIDEITSKVRKEITRTTKKLRTPLKRSSPLRAVASNPVLRQAGSPATTPLRARGRGQKIHSRLNVGCALGWLAE